MGIPGIDFRIAIGDRRPVHLDKTRSGFDQAAGKEGTLAKSVTAIAVADFVVFFGEIESVAGAARENEVESLLIITVEGVAGDSLLHVGHRVVDLLEQRGAALE